MELTWAVTTIVLILQISHVTAKGKRPLKLDFLEDICSQERTVPFDLDTKECSTGYKAIGGCCYKCTECEPGYEKYGTSKSNCFTSCVPCKREAPFFYFSNAEVGTDICHQCLNCAILNRITESNCTRTENAKCGQCLVGFMPESNGDDTTRPCFADSGFKKATLKTTLPYTEHIRIDDPVGAGYTTVIHSNESHNKFLLPCLCAVLGIICIALLAIIIRGKYCKKSYKPKQQQQENGEEKHLLDRVIAEHSIIFENRDNEAKLQATPLADGRVSQRTSISDVPFRVECTGRSPAELQSLDGTLITSLGSERSDQDDRRMNSDVIQPEHEGQKRKRHPSWSDKVQNSVVIESGVSRSLTGQIPNCAQPPFTRSISLPTGDDERFLLETRMDNGDKPVEVTGSTIDTMPNEKILSMAKEKADKMLINKVPSNILHNLACYLDSNAASMNPTICKGRQHFATKLGVPEPMAQSFKTSSELFEHLKTKRVPLHKMLDALFTIERFDALSAVYKGMAASFQFN